MIIGDKSSEKKVSRYWDKAKNAFIIKILPGEYYHSTQKVFISTTLGSCVSACIWDEKNKVGGMNHFMLPLTDKNSSEVTWGNLPTEATRYGNFAMEFLINEMLQCGGNKIDFKVKLFGGGKVLEGSGDVGKRNIDFVLDYIESENLNLISQDLGDIYPRKVLFDPINGRAWMKKLKDETDTTIKLREEQYRKSINVEQISGDIDLF